MKVAVHPRATLSGSVEFENPNMKPKGTVLVGLRRENSTGTLTTAVRPDGSFTLEGMTVRIRASDRTGGVEGFVKDGEKPVVGAMVVLAPAGQAAAVQ